MAYESRNSVKTVRYLGACKRCRVAGAPCAIRAEVEVETICTEHPRRHVSSGLEMRPEIHYTYVVGGLRTTDPRYHSVSHTCGATVLLKRVHGVTTEKKCGARCLSSHGPSCECSCGGANHGSGIAS